MNMLLKYWKHIAAVIASMTSLVGIAFGVDNYFAKSVELAVTNIRLEQKILSDKVDRLQERLWKLEDRYKNENAMPIDVRNEYRQIKQERDKTILELQMNK